MGYFAAQAIPAHGLLSVYIRITDVAWDLVLACRG